MFARARVCVCAELCKSFAPAQILSCARLRGNCVCVCARVRVSQMQDARSVVDMMQFRPAAKHATGIEQARN